MTTDNPPIAGSSGARRAVRPRRPHAAAGSRAAAVALSATAAAGLMIAMGWSDAPKTSAASVDTAGQVPTVAPAPSTVSRPNILLPVPSLDGSVATTATTMVTQATPQPVVLQPQRRTVVVKSNGSR